jgi:hypothetical protein
MYRALVGICCLLSLVFSATVEAREKPTDVKSVGESVCASLREATPGLYGLCLAFHHGMACQPEMGASDPFANCVPGSERVLEQYRKKMRNGDPDMPGIQAPCPCWTKVELLQLSRPTDGDVSRCEIDKMSGALANQDIWTLIHRSGFNMQFTSVQTVEEVSGGGASGCALRDDANGILRNYNITRKEFLSCEPDVVWSAADRGIDCVSRTGE